MDKTRREEFLQSQSIQKFINQYGMFVMCWGNFEVYMEFLYWFFKGRDCRAEINPLECCREFNVENTGKKCDMLTRLLKKLGRQDIIDALDKVINVADRNGWIHGHVIIPDKYFEHLTHFRADRESGEVRVERIAPDEAVFERFYEAYDEFEEMILGSYGISWEYCSMYLDWVRIEQISECQQKEAKRLQKETKKLEDENTRLRSKIQTLKRDLLEKARLEGNLPEARKFLESLGE